MKIQFPDDETRHHDDRTGKYHNNIVGGAVDEEDDQLPGYGILMHWPRHKKKNQQPCILQPQRTAHTP